jgi:hypothetical protein
MLMWLNVQMPRVELLRAPADKMQALAFKAVPAINQLGIRLAHRIYS